jgi:hypothetical protein
MRRWSEWACLLEHLQVARYLVGGLAGWRIGAYLADVHTTKPVVMTVEFGLV